MTPGVGGTATELSTPPGHDGALAPPVRHDRRRRGDVVRRKLLVADVLGLTAAFVGLELWLGAGGDGTSDRIPVKSELLLFGASLPFWIILALAIGLYDRDEERPEHTTVDDAAGVVLLVTTSVWLIFVVSYFAGIASPDLGKWIYFWILAIVLVVVFRSIARYLARRSPAYMQRAIVLGTDRTGQLLGRKIAMHPEYRIQIVGFADESPRPLRRELEGVPIIGSADDVRRMVRRHDVDRVFVAFSGAPDRRMMEIARELQAIGVQVDIIPRLFEAIGPGVTLTSLEGFHLVTLLPLRLRRSALMLKRAFDIVVSSALLVLTLPLFLAIAIWIKRDSPGPVFFRQVRLGFDQRRFMALKFRTMRADTSADAHRDYIRQSMDPTASPEDSGVFKLERPDSVTRSGRWLRKTSLDELPQLINVLRGEMSLVGPRPCIPYETEHFLPHHFERFNVPAGITGLWQVKARARSTFGEALEMDVQYARSWSFWLDVMLLLQTPVQIFRPKATQ